MNSVKRQIYKVIENKETGSVELVELTAPTPKELHTVLQDSMDPRMCDADGKVYDSRSAMRRGIKASGAVEIGESDRLRMLQSKRSMTFEPNDRALADSIERAEADLRENRVRVPETPREVRELWDRIEKGQN